MAASTFYFKIAVHSLEKSEGETIQLNYGASRFSGHDSVQWMIYTNLSYAQDEL